MKATEFEFRQRFWLIMLLFWGGFWLYGLDHVNVTDWAVRHIVPGNDSLDRLLDRVGFAFAAFLLLLAAWLRTWAAAYLQSSVVHDAQLHSDAMVADGPYRYMRNPLYLGGLLLTVGVGFLASRAGFVFMVVGMTLLYFRLMGLEEANLSREQGDPYREFCRLVPRFWPSLMPRVPRGNLAPKWGQAFLGELFMWGFFVGVACFAVTLNIHITWWIIGVTLGLWIIRAFVIHRHTKPGQGSAPQPDGGNASL